MADATVATQIHETLDVHRRLTAQIAFNGEARYGAAKFCNFRLGEILYLRRPSHAGCFADLTRARVPDAIDRRQRDYDVLVQRYVYACYTCHEYLPFD